MSFTIASAKTLAESWSEEYLGDAPIIIWGNEFVQRIVGSKLWAKETEPFTNAVAKTEYELPSEFFRSVKVGDINGVQYKGYNISNGYISFLTDGTYTLTYIAYPTAITSIAGSGSIVPLPDAFIYPLAEFLLFKLFNIELDDEDSKGAAQEYEARYNASLKSIYNNMELNSETESFQVRMRWS